MLRSASPGDWKDSPLVRQSSDLRNAEHPKCRYPDFATYAAQAQAAQPLYYLLDVWMSHRSFSLSPV
jgi:hypothetical protein